MVLGLSLGSRVGRAAAQTPEPSVELLAHGRADFSELIGGPAEIYTSKIILPVGAVIPWHTHPGPVFGVINAGALTVYEDAAGCATTYEAGAAVFVPLGMTHEEHNDGGETLELIATYVVPEGSPLRLPAMPPPQAAC
jgi:quercetin dioxygenase-like cupin family protein